MRIRGLVELRILAVAWVVCAARLCWLGSVHAAEFFVSPKGEGSNPGTRERPWSLEHGLSKAASVKPGDTVWLRGGVYRGKFKSELEGSADGPITVASMAGEWARIDSAEQGGRQNILQIAGRHTVYRDFEVTSSDPVRSSRMAGSSPADIRRGEGIHVRAPQTKLINLIIHDAALGIAAWAEASDTEIYGCLIYNNGWRGPDRAHGHGIYAQNRAGKKMIRDNVIFNQFDKGIQIYGSESAALRNFEVEGNTVFNNGALAGEFSENLVVYGGGGPEGIRIRNNFFYGTGQEGKLLVGGLGARDLVFQDNYVAQLARFRNWQRCLVTGNTWVRSDLMVEVQGWEPSRSWLWDNNQYWAPNGGRDGFLLGGSEIIRRLGGGRLSFELWKRKTGFDWNGRLERKYPTTKVFVRTNAYEPGRATITVFNWDQHPRVKVNLDRVLAPGRKFEIRNAQDYFGVPVVTSEYAGGEVAIPLTDQKAAVPAGWPAPASTGREFNVFMLQNYGRTFRN